MFWKRSAKSPIKEDDELWLEDDLKWLVLEFGYEFSRNIRTQQPTRQFFDHTFTATELDAYFVLDTVCETMDVNSDKVELNFIEEAAKEIGGFQFTPSSRLDGSYKGVAGLYSTNILGNTEIHLHKSQLANPQSMIATIAHEISHAKLLGENRLDENDEYLTDLCAIFFGYGIFLGNSRFSMINKPGLGGWSSSTQGYLPEQIIAYAMALLQPFRNEDDVWKSHLHKGMRKFYDQSSAYIKSNADVGIFK